MIANKKGLKDRFSSIKIRRYGLNECPPLGQYKAKGRDPRLIRDIIAPGGLPWRRGIEYIVWCLKQGMFELSKPAMEFLKEKARELK